MKTTIYAKLDWFLLRLRFVPQCANNLPDIANKVLLCCSFELPASGVVFSSPPSQKALKTYALVVCDALKIREQQLYMVNIKIV